jgi:uncharacterized membrane protein YoaK (UPF0700 family)
VNQETSPAAPGRATRRRDVLVVVLALTAGALDAVTFLRLGHVFSSVITGNFVLLGVAASQGHAAPALSAGLALAGYAAGALACGPIVGAQARDQPAWPRRVTVALAAELMLLLAFGGTWLAAGAHPAGAARLVLLILGAAAMGMQSTAVRRLGQMSSTYMTSTLTGLLAGLATRALPSGWPRSTGAILAITAGAALGALAALRAPWWVPAAIVLPEAAVVAIAAILRDRDDLPGENRGVIGRDHGVGPGETAAS